MIPNNRRIDPIAERDMLAAARAETDAFRARVATAHARIGIALSEAKRPYVSISGGKDSMVVWHLVERITGGVTVYWTDDELEYPETVAMMERLAGAPEFVTAMSCSLHAGWFLPWSDRPFWRDPLPGALVREGRTDDWMARRGHDLTFLGLRASEGPKRKAWLHYANIEFGGAWYPVREGTGKRCCPIWDWSVEDVWAYTVAHNLPVNPAYNVLALIDVPLDRQRVGPLPLTPRAHLAAGWPDMLARLEDRYGKRWI